MPLSREIDLWLDEKLSPDGRRDLFVAIAGEAISAFEEGWRGAYGGYPDFQHFVDGRPSGNPYEVRIPGGFVAERVVTIGPIVKRAIELLDKLTKVVTGDYKSRTHIYRNDAEIAFGDTAFTDDDLIVIGNLAEFARLAEQRAFNITDGGRFRTGLFETVAAMLKREFANSSVPIYFTYRALSGDIEDRVPIIAIGSNATDAGKRPKGSRSRTVTAKSFAQAYAKKTGR